MSAGWIATVSVLGSMLYLAIGGGIAGPLAYRYFEEEVTAGYIALFWPAALVVAAAGSLLWALGWFARFVAERAR